MFEPLTAEDLEHFKEPCRDPRHNPPTHILITQPVAWVCQSCGRRVVITPPVVRFRVCHVVGQAVTE
jgi:hypothetical protein